jgi:hypothetical protein
MEHKKAYFRKQEYEDFIARFSVTTEALESVISEEDETVASMSMAFRKNSVRRSAKKHFVNSISISINGM